ncbi:WYL domain-containing protein [bacterium]|nr:WYL domain-containing protein [bacterium]
MSKLQPLQRQWMVLRTLCARRYGATVRELANEHQCSLKTIRRDLELLQGLGFPISDEEREHGCKYWVAKSDSTTPTLKFDFSEILGLYVSRMLLEPLAGTVLWEATQSAFRKIKATLGEPAVAYLHQLSGLIHRTSFRESDYSRQAEVIDHLMVAIEECRISFITYQSARSTEPLTYDVYPYGLVYHRGSIYLIAHSQQHNMIRTFKLERISEVTIEVLKFQRPHDFDLQHYFQNSLGIYHSAEEPQRVVIRFTPEVARYVEEHHWHASQQLHREKDGYLRVELEIAALEEVKSWVLSFGAQAVVEEPLELRETIQSEITQLNAVYEQVATRVTREDES